MDDCIFCSIASGRIKSDTVYSDDKVIAFKDISPQAPHHFVVIPREHYARLEDVMSGDIFSGIFGAINAIITKTGLDKGGYRVVANSGRDGGQTVDHIHFHVLGGRQMKWPPG